MPVKDPAAIENDLLKVITNLAIFATVESAGRSGDLDDVNEFKNYPSANPLLISLKDLGIRSRPASELKYVVLVQNKNESGEAEAAADTYSLCLQVRAAVLGQSFKIDNIEPFADGSIKLVDYYQGVITYAVTFVTNYYEPPVVDRREEVL